MDGNVSSVGNNQYVKYVKYGNVSCVGNIQYVKYDNVSCVGNNQYVKFGKVSCVGIITNI